jgi:hypothetical protein
MPWGEVVSDAARGDEMGPKKTETKAKKQQATGAEMSPEFLKILQAGGQSDDISGVFMMDAAITAHSQKEILVQLEVNPLVEIKHERKARAI